MLTNLSNTHKAFLAVGTVVMGLAYATKKAFDKDAGKTSKAAQSWMQQGLNLCRNSSTTQKLAVGVVVLTSVAFPQLSATHKAFVAIGAVVASLGIATKVAYDLDQAG